MSQKNETPVLILSLVVTLGLLGAGGWWIADRFLGLGGLTESGQTSVRAEQNGRGASAVSDRLSQGERILLPDGNTADKQAGAQAFAQGNYSEAVIAFEAALRAQRNDPEALVYLNNARIGDQQAYTLAVSLPVGSNPNAAAEILRGAAQVQNSLNAAGGINGVPLKILVANDDNDPNTARNIAQALVDNPEVLGVVGHYASDVTIATTEVYNAGELVTISPISTSVKLSGASPYVFRTVPSDYVAARSLANHMLEKMQEQQAAVFYNSRSGYSQSLRSEFVTALGLGGGQVVSEFDLSESGFSPSRSVDQAIQQGAKTLVLLMDSDELDEALQVAQVNRQRLKLLAGDDFYAPKALEVGGESVTGTVVAIPWHILSDPRSGFVQSSRQLWGGDVNWRTAMAFDATQALVEALRQSPDRRGVQQALSSSNFAAGGASGTVKFLPSGDRNQSAQLVTVQPGTRSGYGYDFVPISR